MLKYMLDTNILIYTMKNKPAEVKRAFEKRYNQICMSTISLMELIYGAENSANPTRNLNEIDGLIARLDVIDYDTSAAAHTGQIRAQLRRSGQPIGAYDMMLAGHARALGLTLVSNNLREFKKVEGLLTTNWVK